MGPWLGPGARRWGEFREGQSQRSSPKGPLGPATQDSATLPAPSPDHSKLKLSTAGGSVGVGWVARAPPPGPALPGPAPCRQPSSHALDLKQLHIRVVPDGRVHVPAEGAGCPWGGLAGTTVGVQAVPEPRPPLPDVPPRRPAPNQTEPPG